MIPVMLIEDEFLVRIGIKTCVSWEKEGYEVVAEAENGEDALELYRKYWPKLVITDIRLPHKTGIEVMKEIREKSSDVKFIIVSAYDDFEIAREAIRIGVEGYFVKGSLDPQELTELLRKLKGIWVNTGTLLEENEKKRESLKYIYRKLQFEETSSDLAKWIKDGNNEVYIWILKLNNTNLEAFVQMVSDFLVRKEVNSRLGVEESFVWIVSEVRLERLCELQGEMRSMFRRYVPCDVAVGISKKYSVCCALDEMIYEAVMAVHASRITGQGSYIVYKESHEPDSIYDRNVRKIDELLRLNQIEPAIQILQEISMLFGKNYSVKRYQRFLYKLAGILNDYDTENYEAGYYEELLGLLDVEESFDSLRQRMHRIGFKNEGKTEGNEYAAKAVEYVYDHYQERINTSKIAEYIHVSSNYLGKLFYSTTGEYLTDFISRIRVEKAQVLLAESKLSIGEVAAAVGIGDQRYFAKLFKKYCGVTPKEYRGLKGNR